MQREKLKIEEKELDFGFVVLNVQFNETGHYALRLTLENPLLEGSGSGVQLRVNDGDVLYTNTGITDIIEQSNLNEVYFFNQQKFVFTLPRGFCKNDKNHDVRLRIEALQTKESSLNNAKKAGEAFFAIYPRTNQPRINLYAGKNEDLYHYSNIMTLLRVKNDELAMHCGRLAYTVFFRESRPPVKEVALTPLVPLPTQNRQEDRPLTIQANRTPSPLPPEETAKTQHALFGDVNQPDTDDQSHRTPTPYPIDKHYSPELQPAENEPEYYEQQSEPADDTPPASPVQEENAPSRLPSSSSLHFPSPAYTPVSSPEHRKVTENPLGVMDHSQFNDPHDPAVCPPGKEAISIILHGATNLPSTTDGSVPQPFVIVRRRGASDKQRPKLNLGVTHATLQPTYSPSWEEKVTLEMDKEDTDNEDVVLHIADSISKELLAEFCIPVRYLQPFHHYHLELQKVRHTHSLACSHSAVTTVLLYNRTHAVQHNVCKDTTVTQYFFVQVNSSTKHTVILHVIIMFKFQVKIHCKLICLLLSNVQNDPPGGGLLVSLGCSPSMAENVL
ncbi:coiled-coil domain-containing protein 33-like [Protopterus annectens]|uniref:coiled-coil domain-containing protein 33-like n=1 Tax=Protopterus annectens TaxID=7888 RepID=UPI001CFA2495|nr:coiled-coil domain-containing protein 33-like [Protopterus annectens]